jgi:hypothetical protein
MGQTLAQAVCGLRVKADCVLALAPTNMSLLADAFATLLGVAIYAL